MGLTLLEQETIVNFNRAEEEMQVYTCDPIIMRKLSNLPAYTLIREDKQEGQTIAMTFKADKGLLTFRSARQKKRDYTPEELEELRERARIMNQNQAKNTTARPLLKN